MTKTNVDLKSLSFAGVEKENLNWKFISDEKKTKIPQVDAILERESFFFLFVEFFMMLRCCFVNLKFFVNKIEIAVKFMW